MCKQECVMINYCKTILEKVSFNKQLFERELRKASGFVSLKEYKELVNWCMQNFDGALLLVTKKVALERLI